MAWKIVCGLCSQEHTEAIESYAEAVRAMAGLVEAGARRGLPDDLLALLQVVPQEHVYSLGQWVHPDDAAEPAAKQLGDLLPKLPPWKR